MFMLKYIYADVSLWTCMCMHSCVYSLCTGMFGHIYAQILLWTNSIRQTCTGTFKQRYTLCTSAFLPRVRHFSNKYHQFCLCTGVGMHMFVFAQVCLQFMVYAQVCLCTGIFMRRYFYKQVKSDICTFMQMYIYVRVPLQQHTFA